MPRANDCSIDCELRIADWHANSNPQSAILPPPSAFTLVEMLVAMAITLVMMGAVVTLFANVSNSVRDRRAVIEISGQLRHARNMLQQDLQGATCPGLTWRRPEENQGYIEIIEGPYHEGNASALLDYDPVANKNPPAGANPEIDHTTSIIPTSNLLDTTVAAKSKWVTDGAGLGDADDTLMLTVRNDHEPFVGNMPANVRTSSTGNADTFANWTSQTIESPLAEVVWYAVENPGFTDLASTDQYGGFFGEPGMRTIYRRTLLIAPWVNPYRFVDNTGTVSDTFTEFGRNGGKTFNAQPGLVRILKANIAPEQAIASLIAFQERYDLSVRLEFDPLLDPANNGRWKIVANTLGDLTKRENRYEHHSFRSKATALKPIGREFPFAVVSKGNGYTATGVTFVTDPEIAAATTVPTVNAQLDPTNNSAPSYTVTNRGAGYLVRPFAFINQNCNASASTRAMLNDNNEVVQVIPGLVPLSGARRGEDVMLSDALAFDLRVFDPGAPLYPSITDTTNANYPGTILEPSDPGWPLVAFKDVDANNTAANPNPIGVGAYVDLGYWNAYVWQNIRNGTWGPANATFLPGSLKNPSSYGSTASQFFGPPSPKSQLRYTDFNNASYNLNDLRDYDYCTYDTWSFHYEHDGVNENQVLETALGEPTPLVVDKGTNGLDDVGEYINSATGQFIKPTAAAPQVILGPDDVGERETAPPYDKPLRGMQVIMRVYERDSRQIRQVSVDQQFVPE